MDQDERLRGCSGNDSSPCPRCRSVRVRSGITLHLGYGRTERPLPTRPSHELPRAPLGTLPTVIATVVRHGRVGIAVVAIRTARTARDRGQQETQNDGPRDDVARAETRASSGGGRARHRTRVALPPFGLRTMCPPRLLESHHLLNLPIGRKPRPPKNLVLGLAWIRCRL